MINFIDWSSIALLVRGGPLAVAAAALSLFVPLSPAGHSPASAAQNDEDEQVVEVEPYGFARLDTVLLTHRMNQPQYSMWVRPDGVSSGGTPNLTIYGRLTRFGLKFDGSALTDGVDLIGKVEADFQNGGSESRPAPRLRHGYGRASTDLWFLLAGQTWDLVSPLYPSAHADALMWNAGNLGDRRPQLRLGLTPGSEEFGVRVGAAAATTGAIDGKDLDGNGRLDGFDSGVPMLQALAELHWNNWADEPLTFGVSGSWAIERLSEDSSDGGGGGTPYGGEDVFYSRSINGHLKVPLTGSLQLRGEAFYGSNLSDVRGGIGQGVTRAEGTEVRAAGGWAEVGVQPVEPYEVSVGVSIDDPFDNDLPDADGTTARTLNRTLFAVQKFRPWEPVQFGLEYWYWRTDYIGAETGDAHRVNVHSSFYF